ncbi:MAG: hypothetical protein AMXMBFR84_21110 [Candidatus Hydrogenedentota bacterium]
MARKKSSKPIPRVSEAEWDILKPLWDDGPLAARDIIARLDGKRDWAAKTVKTMLARLVEKGVIEYDQIGNSYLYRTVYTRDEMTRAAMGSFLDRVFDGAMRPFLAHFAEHVSDDELRLLRAELKRIERVKQEDSEG